MTVLHQRASPPHIDASISNSMGHPFRDALPYLLILQLQTLFTLFSNGRSQGRYSPHSPLGNVTVTLTAAIHKKTTRKGVRPDATFQPSFLKSLVRSSAGALRIAPWTVFAEHTRIPSHDVRRVLVPFSRCMYTRFCLANWGCFYGERLRELYVSVFSLDLCVAFACVRSVLCSVHVNFSWRPTWRDELPKAESLLKAMRLFVFSKGIRTLNLLAYNEQR
uniref:Uncharacterized protein n=1 Tax=Steinernema glaseri TaxID=37863 RepID=A0A1I7ZKL7_9BILA